MKAFILTLQIILILGTIFSLYRVLKTSSLKELSKTRYDGMLFMILFYIILISNVSLKEGFSISVDEILIFNFLGLLLGLVILFLQNSKELHFKYKRDLSKLESKYNKS